MTRISSLLLVFFSLFLSLPASAAHYNVSTIEEAYSRCETAKAGSSSYISHTCMDSPTTASAIELRQSWANPHSYVHRYIYAQGCPDGGSYDPSAGQCEVPVTDESCQEKPDITHVQTVSAQDFYSGAVTQIRVSKDQCEYSWNHSAAEALDCYQKTDGSFQCYLAMTPENAGEDEVAAVEPITGDGDAVEVEASTEQNNETGITVTEETKKDKEPDGTETTTTTKTETASDGTETVTETTEKKNPDGTVTTIVNQTVNYPDGTSETTISGTKTETPENDEDKRSASLGDCGAPVQCKGDAIDCAILEQQKKDYCATEKGIEDTKDLIEQNTSGVGKLGDEGLDLTDSTEINLSEKMGDWQNVADPTPGQCPAPRELKLGLGTFQVKWEPWCDFATSIRPFTIFMFSFIGAMAIARTFTR